jgi:2-oxoisovalerate dehydrogenase E1 component
MGRNDGDALETPRLVDLYRHMLAAREVDRLEDGYTKRGEAFFHVSGAGHEGSVVLADILGPQDWLHCHYRDKALMLARGVSPEMFFHSLFCKDASHSRGRQMSAHISAPELNILSLVGPVGNNALPSAGIAAELKDRQGSPVVLCALGDGMTQEGEVLESIAHAVREELRVLYFIEDNVYAISTQTRGKTFFSTPDGDPDSFYSLPIHRIDGCDLLSAHASLAKIVEGMRSEPGPAIVLFQVDRLTNHTNADDQSAYRSAEDVEDLRARRDPLSHAREILIGRGISAEELDELEDQVKSEVAAAADKSRRSGEPQAVHDAKRPLSAEYLGKSEYRGEKGPVTMLEAIREAFRIKLGEDRRVSLFGEDLEDPKGDVFGITKGLSKSYPGRVQNSPLSESTIAGVSVGRALAGGRPVGFIQFADFLPIAYNQIFSEMGSMYWRTDGGWEAPVILMITSGGYKPGLGPFHASSLEALGVHTPGVDVVMPSTAGDAAGLLNASFESGRPTMFYYPKNCLNNREQATSEDIAEHFVPVGKARVVRSGGDITMVGYGNTMDLMYRAAEALAEAGVEAEVIDLRSLSPWDEQCVISSVKKTGRVIVAHEDNKSAGFGAEILAVLAEALPQGFDGRRVVRGDTYVPCNFGNQLEVLPSYARILDTAVDMLGGSLQWEAEIAAEEGSFLIEAIGSSPSDEMVTVIEYLVSPGDSIKEGQIVASVEADKAVTEIASPMTGTVDRFLAEEGDEVAVGKPLISILTDESAVPKPPTREEPGTPKISFPFRRKAAAASAGSPTEESQAGTASAVAITSVRSVTGSRIVSNEEISRLCPTWAPEDIVKRTGIESRYWAGEDEDITGMASRAARDLLTDRGMDPADLGMIICSSGTPDEMTPSLACRILDALSADSRSGEDIEVPAVDISAACSGYIYGLQQAYDFLQSDPEKKPVLLVTAELLSRRVDPSDPDTAPIFGDAATASLIEASDSSLAGSAAGSAESGNTALRIHRPLTLASPDHGRKLTVPAREGFAEEAIYMDGPAIYQKAVRAMMKSLDLAARRAGFEAENLDLLVPHQANQRIINAVRQRMKLGKDRVYSMIASYGNTSSSTIPLCLERIMADRSDNPAPALRTLGLTAFGGGFTYAGAVLEFIGD